MRDGIYKNPLLPKPWRALLKSCTLDAERGETAREKCERAAGAELCGIPPQFMNAFREKAEQSLLPGFKAFGDEGTSIDLGGQNSPLTNQILAHARRFESAGLKGAELEQASYAGALQETMNAQLRLMEQTILASGSDPESKATVRAARCALGDARIVPIIDSFLADRSLDLPPAQRPIDLDEDLSRSRP